MTEWGQHPSEMTNRRLLFWIGIGLFGMLSPLVQLWETNSISWISLGVGMFTSVVVFSEYASSTKLGQMIDDWWDRIGIGGRFLVLVTVTAIVWGVIWVFRPPTVPIHSFALGMFVGLTAKVGFVLLKRTAINGQQADGGC
ncbi:hypothetical protein [Saliphagus sp. LR7]|uniref:hypothetical protein n=1 Tax=Saliphagus sp. LR7 TaxID=2282654 RepID=UPI000DF797A6|nr:hypothetical protein [Saliphagus sp. LR7]